MNRERTRVAVSQSIAPAKSQAFSCRGNSAFPAAPFQQQACGELALGAATGQEQTFGSGRLWCFKLHE